MTKAYDDHIIEVLSRFYADAKASKIYHGRATSWLVVTDQMDEYFYLMMRTDSQVQDLYDKARDKAALITNSPLYKALQDD